MEQKANAPPTDPFALGPNDSAEAWADVLDACHRADDVANALSRFHSANWDTYVKWARHHAAQLANRVDRHSIDNALSYVTEVAAEAAAEWPRAKTNIRSWPGYVHSKSRSAFRTAMTSPSTTGLTGLSTRLRRRRSLARTAEQLTKQMGREPSNEEVVETYNIQVTRSRKDAARQGALATVDDMEWKAPLSTDELIQTPADPDDGGILGGGGSMLSRHEAVDFTIDVIEECERRSDILGMVAQARFGEYGDYSVSITQIADELGITHHVARTSVIEVVDVAKAVLYEGIGMTQQSLWDGVDDPKAWAAHGFGPRGADRWSKAGFSPVRASKWVVVALSPSGVKPWVDEGFTPHQAQHLSDAGMDPKQALDWIEQQDFDDDNGQRATG